MKITRRSEYLTTPKEYFARCLKNDTDHTYFKSAFKIGFSVASNYHTENYFNKDKTASTATRISLFALACLMGFFTLLGGTIASPFLLIGSGIASGIEKIKEKKQETNECGVPIVHIPANEVKKDADDESTTRYSTVITIKASDFFNNTCKKVKALFSNEEEIL